jgi:DNA-binding transcriptional LysR family regulator
MDVRHLRHFVAVAEMLHFGRAAEKLCMTQPPLSQSIMALERELGTPLFTRTKRSVALTPFGIEWLAPVRQALDAIDILPETAKRLREGRAGQLTLSFVSSADYSVLPWLVRRYSALFPDVEIKLIEATSDVQIPAVTDGQVHAGIIIQPHETALPGVLEYRRLMSEVLIAAVPETWVAEKRVTVFDGKMSTDAVLGAPLIIFPRGVAPAFYDLVIGYYAGIGGRVDIVQEAIQMQTIISLVSAGLGMALVPASLRNLVRAGVVYVDLPGKIPTLDTGLIWCRDDSTPTLKQFLQIVESLDTLKEG